MLDTELSAIVGGAGMEWTGLFGVLVATPGEWNLRAYRGDARRGVLVFADLRAVRLEVRWRRGRRTPEPLDRRLSRHKRPTDVSELAPGVLRVAGTERTDVLTADGERRYELHFPGAWNEAAAACATAFVAAQRALSGRKERYWSVYGAAGWAPAGAKARAITLLPGQTELRLTYRRGGVTLGSFSLADRLLAGRTLLDWAKGPERKWPLGDHWENRGDAGVRLRVVRRRWWRRMTHQITARHDAAANRILWQHRVTYGLSGESSDERAPGG